MLIRAHPVHSRNEQPAVIPVIKVEDATRIRTTSDAMLYFIITLNKTTTVPVSVNDVFTDGSVSSSGDYPKKSGTIAIPAKQAQSQLNVVIKGYPEDILENNLATDNTGYTTPLTYAGHTLCWSDKFSGETLNATAWNYEIGSGSGGWGNNEMEYNTSNNKNIFLYNENLIIEARTTHVCRLCSCFSIMLQNCYYQPDKIIKPLCIPFIYSS